METIVELPEFQRKAASLLSEHEKQGIINYLAAHPQASAVMQGTGGIRKFRWASGNIGKSGGVRVKSSPRRETMSLFLLSLFGKSEKANMTKSEKMN